jgi:predicted Zn finger-like uncharacterized protein
MIIQCEQCNTKFRLDDSKVKDKGVKVRCAKCKHVFTVKKEQPDGATQADFGTMFDQAASLDQEEPSSDIGEESSELFASSQEIPAPGPAPISPFDTSIFGPDDDSENTVSMNAPMFDLSKSEADQVTSPFGDDFNLSSLKDDQGFALEQEQTNPATGEIDFSGFEFGDSAADADKTVLSAAPGGMSQTPPDAAKEEPANVDFGGEDLFGDVVAESTPEEPGEPIQFDFQMEEFADSMGVDADTGEKIQLEAADTKADEPFSLGEIDFGDELSSVAIQQVHPDELKPAQELLFAPLAKAQVKPAAVEQDTLKTGAIDRTSQSAQDELPPLSISSRRKQSPLFSGLVIAVAVVAVAVLGFFGYSMFIADKGKVAVEAGRIMVRNVDASFVKNKSLGDLLVITGETINEFTKPRAAIQIKGMIYDANNQVLSTKTAYCGNPLTKEQLATMPLDKIDSVMANQFGDSLANMEVAPGKSIPFVIVIANIPAEARDYGVEPAGSTVATGKQQ